jgi:hypothetical protein
MPESRAPSANPSLGVLWRVVQMDAEEGNGYVVLRSDDLDGLHWDSTPRCGRSGSKSSCRATCSRSRSDKEGRTESLSLDGCIVCVESDPPRRREFSATMVRETLVSIREEGGLGHGGCFRFNMSSHMSAIGSKNA